MKKQISQIVLLHLIIILTIFSCSKDEKVDTTPPGILSNISVVPTNGGGIISYSLPLDDDISYVRAEYTNSQGEDVFRVSSKYNTSIEVNGLNQTTPIQISLYVVDENENISEVLEIEFTPLESFIFLVQQSIEIIPALGGVKITWENIASKTVFVYVHILKGNEETIRILSSNNSEEILYLRGLESVEMTFSTKVEDFDGNITDLQEVGVYTPLFEEKIEKNTWALVASQSFNGNAYEGRTINFWDDIVDT